jgi:hypothetical protein
LVHGSIDHAQVVESDFRVIGEMRELTMSFGSFYLNHFLNTKNEKNIAPRIHTRDVDNNTLAKR